MRSESVIKTVLLEDMGLNNSSRNTDSVIRAYEKRYGSRVSNWWKLEQDLRVLLRSSYPDRFILGRSIVRKALEKGLNYVYVSSDGNCVKFRQALFKTRSGDFMRRVRMVFN